MSARAGGAGGSAAAAATATDNNTTNPNPAPETLAQAIERVWGRQRGWPGRSEQTRESRVSANWANLWVLPTDVAQAVKTRGTGE
jgi:hypothetical protein